MRPVSTQEIGEGMIADIGDDADDADVVNWLVNEAQAIAQAVMAETDHAKAEVIALGLVSVRSVAIDGDFQNEVVDKMEVDVR
jgi:hypothetical protein